MSGEAHFIAIDLGASAGRVILGQWDGARFELCELHRFPNQPVTVMGNLHWDVLRLWSEVKAGLRHYTARFDTPPASIGVDTWGVDYALLDRAGNLLGNPYSYRDHRTDTMEERIVRQVPRAQIFAQTGIQFIQINTLYQILSMVDAGDPQLAAADTLLMLPDLFHYWLSGRRVAEYTIASTSQLLHCRQRQWATDLMQQFNIPAQIFPPVVAPGTIIGELRPEVIDEVGLRQPVPVIAPGSHDTASAVAAVPGLDAQSAYLSSGTWSLMGVEVAQPVISDQALALNVTNEGGVAGTIRLLKNISGLWLLQACRRQWERQGQAFAWETLLAMAEQAAPFRSLVDPDDASFHNPEDMPAAICAYCRRTGQPEPEGIAAVVRCCLESLALRYRRVLHALEQLTGRRIETIRIVGGGSQNRRLCQFTADACNRVVVAGPVEATALGNIVVQAIATGYLPDLAAGRRAVAASVRQEWFEPRSHAGWEAAFDRFSRLPELSDA